VVAWRPDSTERVAQTLLTDGIHGFDKRARVYDDLVCHIVDSNELGRLVEVEPSLVEHAKADSWWQMLILGGAIGDGWSGKLLSYEAPTYFGMLTAAFQPKRRATRSKSARASG